MPNWKKNAAVFMGSQALSLFGSSLVQYAIVWYITLNTKSGIYATISILCGFIPTLLLSPFGGVWADRYSRKTLIVLADGGIALCTLILALVFMSGYQAIWLLMAALAIRALGSAVQTPAIQAMLPDIVPTEHLTRVNGINSSVQSLLQLVSPMLAGALLGFADIEMIFFVDVVTAAAAIAVMLLFLRLNAREKPEKPEKPDYFGELREGIRYIGSKAYLRQYFIFFALFFLLFGPVAFLTPLQVARNYGDDVWRLSTIEVTFSVGMLLGGLIVAAWGGLKNRVHSIALSGLVMGVVTAAFCLPMHFYIYSVLMAVFGLIMPFYNTPAVVMLQERIEPGYMGRVFGVFTMISSSVMPLSMLIFGPLADALPIEWLLLLTGVLLLGMSVALLFNKTLLAVGLPPQTPDTAGETAGD